MMFGMAAWITRSSSKEQPMICSPLTFSIRGERENSTPRGPVKHSRALHEYFRHGWSFRESPVVPQSE